LRATQTVQRLHVRRCAGGGRAQLTHRSDAGSAIEPSSTTAQAISNCAKSQVLSWVRWSLYPLTLVVYVKKTR